MHEDIDTSDSLARKKLRKQVLVHAAVVTTCAATRANSP